MQKEWGCVPCGKAVCENRGGESPSMAAIEVNDVLSAVQSVLEKTGWYKAVDSES